MNPHALGRLLAIWPRGGATTPAEFGLLKREARALGIRVDPCVSRGQLRRAATNLAHRYGSPFWKYLNTVKPGVNQHQQAFKIQPGAVVPVTFNGVATTMHIDTARRLQFQGKPWFLEMKVKLNTENMPIILTNETKCDCVYCGTTPRGDETSCRGCGAPLDC